MTRRKFLLAGMLLLMTSACDQLVNTTATETVPAGPSATMTHTVAAVPASPTAPPATTQPAPAVTDTMLPPATQAPLPADTAAATSVPILGEHQIRTGETLSCIGRGYGVLPKAIAEVNGIQLTTTLHVGQVLQIPAVQWTNIPAGPVCPPQFPSPFPGLPVTGSTPLPIDTPTSTFLPVPATPTSTPPPTPTLQVPDTPTPTLCPSRECP